MKKHTHTQIDTFVFDRSSNPWLTDEAVSRIHDVRGFCRTLNTYMYRIPGVSNDADAQVRQETLRGEI